MNIISSILIAVVVISLTPTASFASEFPASDTPFVLNSLFLLVCGALVMFMAAGFTMLEAGSVRAKSVAVILTKNISLYAIASVMFCLIGYNLMFSGEAGGVLGKHSIWTQDDAAAQSGDFALGYASNAFWFFQMVFVATAASIVSGALAERIKLYPFLLFSALLTGLIYPIVGCWTWGGGWLAGIGFSDFAGSTVVHSVGGWAALAGAILLGPRRGRFGADGTANQIPGSSTPQIALGVMILWFGWFGFNGGSQLSFSSAEDAIAVANIFANTNAAAAGGVIVALIASRIIRGKPDLVLTLNGALAGLVAITAEPAAPTIVGAALIGASGGLVMIAGTRLLERLRIDDVVGAVPVHLVAGVWGTLVAGFTNASASVLTQLIGIAAVGAFVFSFSFVVWFVMRVTIGIRLRSFAEDKGGDLSELGVRAYNLEIENATLARPAP